MSVDKFGRHLDSKRIPILSTPTANGGSNILQVNGNLDFRGKRLTNVALPTESTDVVTKDYVDNNFLTPEDGEHYNLRNKRIKEVHAPLAENDAVNKKYVDEVRNNVLQLGPNETWNFRNKRLTNVGNPDSQFDAVNKEYVDRKNLTPDGHYDFAGKRLTRVGDPNLGYDVATKSYVDRGRAQTRYYIDSLPTIKRVGLVNDFDFESKFLHNVKTPMQPFDAVNKEYVDSLHADLKTQIQILVARLKARNQNE